MLSECSKNNKNCDLKHKLSLVTRDNLLTCCKHWNRSAYTKAINVHTTGQMNNAQAFQ